MDTYQPLEDCPKPAIFTEFHALSPFLGVKLDVDIELIPKLRFAGYKGIYYNTKKSLTLASAQYLV